MCGNEINRRTLMSLGIYKHCMYPAIHRYADQEFDNMSEESEKKKLYR